MTKADQPLVTFRLTVLSPVKGVAYSLQGKDNAPVDVHVSTGKDLMFEIPARLAEGKDGWRFLGDHVRTEGRTRRFFYVASGEQAGQAGKDGRRAKIDLPDATPALVRRAAGGALVMEASMHGADAKGMPAAATIKLVSPWKAAT